MKQMIYGLIMMAVVGMFLAMVLTVQGRTTRQNEITQSIDHAMKNTMEYYQNQGREEGMKEDEFMAYFLETFLVGCNSNSQIQVKVLKLDLETGLFSVEIAQNYVHPNGNSGTVLTTRTIICEAESEAQR